MAVFKCKMCGGALEITGETIATCAYCGTRQTLPKLNDDKRANLYDRANHFRRNNEFDKAMGIYEQILNEDSTDAEAYWSLVLCRYGIEYVEDPATRSRIPTINRTQFTSIYDDDNYKSALHYADPLQKEIYENEAKTINEIQKGILAISQKEEPFDVFICYKETDHNGRRTPDSVLAQELYFQLKQEGFKVFFSRITLEDKLGVAYEPYIFAALNSSKVMVVLGTRQEYFNAVWVKNEWSRYLSLIKQGQTKILIPAYRDMDPYDLPEEFSHLQAQDMSRLGFMQDLIRGIKKIAQTETPAATVVKETVVSAGNINTAPLLKRVSMFLEDGEWNRADEFCEMVLNEDPENAQAYLGKLMAELRVKKQEDLKDQAEPFDHSNNYQKAIRFADDALKSTLTGYVDYIVTRNENARLNGIYTRAQSVMSQATTDLAFQEAARLFESIGDYENSAELAQLCHKKAEDAPKDAVLCAGKARMKNHTIPDYETAIKMFESVSGWKDADEQIILCQKKIEELKAKAEAERLEKERKTEIARKEAEKRDKRNKKIAILTTFIVCALIAFLSILSNVIIPNVKYNDAIALMEAGKYTEAISAFEALDGYKDSANKITECKYIYAIALMEAGKLDEAYSAFIELGDYKDASEKADGIRLQKTKDQLKNIKVGSYINFGAYEQYGKEDVEWLVLEIKDGKALVISKYALDCKQYNTNYTDVTWEACTLRKWLNNDFINSAFSAEEKAMIPTVTVSADKNPEYSTNPGNATQDQVFLLSIVEANKYFSSNSARECKPTAYAVANGAWKSDSGNCQWWLRSPGKVQSHAAAVISDGAVYEYGGMVNGDLTAVRPALWIDLNS